jgi:hypothetical protein
MLDEKKAGEKATQVRKIVDWFGENVCSEHRHEHSSLKSSACHLVLTDLKNLKLWFVQLCAAKGSSFSTANTRPLPKKKEAVVLRSPGTARSYVGAFRSYLEYVGSLQVAAQTPGLGDHLSAGLRRLKCYSRSLAAEIKSRQHDRQQLDSETLLSAEELLAVRNTQYFVSNLSVLDSIDNPEQHHNRTEQLMLELRNILLVLVGCSSYQRAGIIPGRLCVYCIVNIGNHF